jgi:hypothetical protein
MRSTYGHAEPGVLFPDRINADYNLCAGAAPCGGRLVKEP